MSALYAGAWGRADSTGIACDDWLEILPAYRDSKIAGPARRRVALESGATGPRSRPVPQPQGFLLKLNEVERAMRAGEFGRVPQIAIEHQLQVGDFLHAEDFVAVTQAHIMADTESLGEEGVRWLESLALEDGGKARVRVPTITDPRGTDFAKASVLKQPIRFLELERRTIEAFKKLGVAMTDTCINYQTIQAPTRGESVAFGDTGVVIYSNSVCGARSNYEGGPSALSAGLTGRTPRYGYHLDAQRRATLRIRTDWTPKTLNEWGALGGLVGRLAGNYWAVPVVEGLEGSPGSDAMKHFGAAMASFGSIALFHLVGITPEAVRIEDCGGDKLPVAHRIGEKDVLALAANYAARRKRKSTSSCSPHRNSAFTNCARSRCSAPGASS